MKSLEDIACAIEESAGQNGFTTVRTWNGDSLQVQFTAHSGRPGPLLALSRDGFNRTVGVLGDKRFNPWPDDMESFAWGRFWRAVREWGRQRPMKAQEFGYGERSRR